MHRKGSRDRNRQPTEWEERLASDTTGRGSASTLHTRLLELSVRAASSHKNGQEVYADVSPTKTGRQTGKRHGGSCSASRLLEMRVRAAGRRRLTLARMAVIRKSRNGRRWRERGEREPTSTAGGNVNWCSHSREQCESSLKNQP